MLIGHSAQLEQFHWFVRAHLENADGSLRTAGARTERSAARRAGLTDARHAGLTGRKDDTGAARLGRG